MCLYSTYQWSCCSGTARPAPYFMNSICPQATRPKMVGAKTKKCKIEFTLLDGADHGESCPKCGKAPPSNEEDEDDE